MPDKEVLTAEDVQELQPLYAAVIAALKEVYDPEIPVNIYDLGLVYELTINKAREVFLLMTFTAPNCPMADQVLAEVQQSVEAVPGVTKCSIELTFDPVWDRSMLSEEARVELGLDYEEDDYSTMYDFAHPLSDWIEGITHSICTLEFEAHRPLYDWFLIELGLDNRPQQIEFARLNLTYTMMSKRKLLELVQTKAVMGWNDPRMPTVCGYRRRGFTPSSIREFCDRIGVSKADSMVDVNLLYFCIREELNQTANRVMAVIDPVKLVIDNWEDGKVEMIEVENNPNDEKAGKRQVPFGKVLYIEADDFMEEPPKKYFRLKPDGEVRLKGAYFVTCKSVEKDENGKVTVIHCEYDPQSKGGETPDGRKVKGTIHWVSAEHAVDAEVRLIDNLFTLEDPAAVPEGEDWHDYLNPESMVIKQAKVEPALANAKLEDRFQFMRQGYFCLDSEDSKPGHLVFNRTVGLKDSFNPSK